MTTATVNSARNEAIKLILALVFVFGFLSTTVYVVTSWLDEGPSVHWTPPAYKAHNKK